MLDYRMKTELNNALLQWVENVASNNNISFSEMEDALVSVTLEIKNKAMKEYIMQLQQQEQQYVNTMSDATMSAEMNESDFSENEINDSIVENESEVVVDE